MADEKKPEGKPAGPPASPQTDPFVEIVWLIVTIMVVMYLINGFIGIIKSGNFSVFGFDATNAQESATLLFWKIFTYVKIIAILLSLLLIAGVVYLYRRLVDLRTEEAKKYYVEKNEFVGVNNPQWEKILNHLESTNESDWRLAILEADIMLDTLLDNLGLPGETMADKLKAVEKSDFTTIDNAWEAHKVRNQIAHEGATFVLNQHETERIIGLFQSVFEEFSII